MIAWRILRELLKTSSETNSVSEIDDANFSWIIERLGASGFGESSRHGIPNEPNLFNTIYKR